MALKYSPKAQAMSDKMLRKRLWVVITKAVAPPEELSRVLEAHLGRGDRLLGWTVCSAIVHPAHGQFNPSPRTTSRVSAARKFRGLAKGEPKAPICASHASFAGPRRGVGVEERLLGRMTEV